MMDLSVLRTAAVCVFVMLCNVSPLWACDCPGPTSERDDLVVKSADLIANVEVLDISKPDWSKVGGTDVDIKIQLYNIYHNDMNAVEGQEITVKNNMSDGCHLNIEKNARRDLMIVRMGGALRVAGMCSEISGAGWAKLKGHD
jgi:hypothetical protein